MPRLDRTGPNGQGPKTGRGLGACANTNRGWRCPGCGFQSPSLDDQEKILEQELAAVREAKRSIKNQQSE